MDAERPRGAAGRAVAAAVESLEGRAYLSAVFQSKIDVPVPGGPAGIAVGDFNGDGILDMGVTKFRNDNTTISVFLGKGGGAFQAPVDYVVGKAPAGIAAADFNGDGKADLIVTNNESHNYTVLIGQGNGQFTPLPSVDTADFPEGVAVGDFNGDGKQDIAIHHPVSVQDRTGIVSVFLGNGDGTFGPALLTSPLGEGPGGLGAGDFNGDGIVDLAVANRGHQNGNGLPADTGTDPNTGTLKILLGKGDGTFASPTTVASGLNFPGGVGVGDFNDDGKSDLALTFFGTLSQPDNHLGVYLALGGGAFQAPTPASTFTTGPGPIAATAGDFNNDGESDLAVAAYGGFTAGVGGDNINLFLAPGNTGLIARLSAPDQTFGAANLKANGTAASPFPLTRSNVLADGTVLSVGSTADSSAGNGAHQFALLVTNADGSERWHAKADFGADSLAAAAARQADGKILVVGTTRDPGGQLHWAFARFGADGTPDLSFGTGGRVIGSALAAGSSLTNLAIQGDGSVVVVGQAGSDMAAWRFTPALAADPTFAGGAVTIRFGTKHKPLASRANALALQSDGKIVVGGLVSGKAGATWFGLARLTASGQLDASFGQGGLVATAVASGVQLSDLKIGSRGRITAVGSPPASPDQPLFARYNSDGSPDTTFGTGGVLASTAATASVVARPAANNFTLLALAFNGTVVQTGPTVLRKVQGLTADTTLPTAVPYQVGSAPAGRSPFVFRVVYHDENKISSGSLSSQNVYVSGPGHFSAAAGLVGVVSQKGGRTKVASYSAPYPGHGWGSGTSGPYKIVLRPNQVDDTSGNFVRSGVLGTFQVAATAAVAPTAVAPTAVAPTAVAPTAVAPTAGPAVVPAAAPFSRVAVALSDAPWGQDADVLAG